MPSSVHRFKGSGGTAGACLLHVLRGLTFIAFSIVFGSQKDAVSNEGAALSLVQNLNVSFLDKTLPSNVCGEALAERLAREPDRTRRPGSGRHVRKVKDRQACSQRYKTNT